MQAQTLPDLRRLSFGNAIPTQPPSILTQHYAPSAPQLPSVIAGLAYLQPTRERPYNYMYQPPQGEPWQNCEYDVRAMRITDARSFSARPSVHVEGFELWDAPSAVTNFQDESAIVDIYYREAAELARAVTGAQRAYVFDHLVRKREAGRPALTFGRHGDGTQAAAAGRIHNDYSEESGRKRLGLVLQDAIEAGAVERYSIVNIWRSIKGPVLDTPLAVCDARTVSATRLVPSEVRYPNRTGEIYLVEHSPRHQWAYYSAMDRHEALVFKQYDSQASGVSRFVPHAAFDHPNTPPDAPLRESIEIRCLVIYE
ncbi:CmcJ/NvfI family oxidoreductase [Andreprevotia chitinilytica]|uniref:CmcJ/NvfI family oxidoreductase n=1 Tax=Andreprevotia chitinilytica TaxID=396808 RepID=UPI000AE11D00|nr:CmcJ/NvfI family oxidoreductase [Andreprevotia chitinilytica]